MADGQTRFDKLNDAARVSFLTSLVDAGTPNISWIASEHADLLEAVWEGNDEIEGPDGQVISPRLHLNLHALVETQYASKKPPAVREVADSLFLRDWDRHEIMHLVCTANVDELLCMLNDEEQFDEERFTRRLLKLLASNAEPAAARAGAPGGIRQRRL